MQLRFMVLITNGPSFSLTARKFLDIVNSLSEQKKKH